MIYLYFIILDISLLFFILIVNVWLVQKRIVLLWLCPKYIQQLKNTHHQLGLVFSSDCGWHTHIITMNGKGWQRINILRSFKFRLDRKSLERIRYLLYGLSLSTVASYGRIVIMITKIQTEPLRIITGATNICNIAKTIPGNGIRNFRGANETNKNL